MTEDHGMPGDGEVLSAGLAEQEFTIVRRGYEPDEVRAFLAEVEMSLRRLEDWAEKTNARLAIAEDKNAAIDDVHQAMIAVFETKERVLEKAERRARRIEADAEKRARAEAEAVSSRLIAEAQEEAQRIVEAALAVGAGSTEESILRAARLEADRLIQDARLEAHRLVADAHLGGGSFGADQASVEAQAPVSTIRQEEEPGLVIDLDAARPEPDASSSGDGGLDRRSRYERTSAGLPSVGDDGADVFDAIRRMRRGLEN